MVFLMSACRLELSQCSFRALGDMSGILVVSWMVSGRAGSEDYRNYGHGALPEQMEEHHLLNIPDFLTWNASSARRSETHWASKSHSNIQLLYIHDFEPKIRPIKR